MVKCCDEEMLVAGQWNHCRVCGKRLVDVPSGKEREFLSDRIVEYVADYQPLWKEFSVIMHELWRAGVYEDYEPKVPYEWKGME